MTPTDPVPSEVLNASCLSRSKQALRLVCAEMPHLAGLARLVRLKPHRQYSVAAVSASGLVCVNPDVFAKIPLADAAFVLAHELLHLALDTHRRQGDADPHIVNVAHDYIINDMLAEELGRAAPLGGLKRFGARSESLEALIVELSKEGKGGRMSCWSSAGRRRPDRRRTPGKSPMRQALEDAGLVPPDDAPPPPPEPSTGRGPPGDLISSHHETALEPELSPVARQALRDEVQRAAAKSLSLAALREKLASAQQGAGAGGDAERGERLMRALKTAYQPPWQLALQRWLDAVAPAGRTYARASRRGADRDDGVVLCGRYREGWTLHIVLDTSGSMTAALPTVLGAVGSFCDAAGVAEIHVLQCDMEVTKDEWLEPAQLAEFTVAGFGGSNMSPAMDRLAEDTEVSSVLVLTDGYISYLANEPPYSVLWALFRSGDGRADNFRPPYGEVVLIDI